MAEEIACPACQTTNDPWNELCDACGAELHADAALEAAATDGDAFTEPQSAGDPGGFEGSEEVHLYEDGNPDSGIGAEDTGAEEVALDQDGGTAEGDDEPESLEYELEAIDEEFDDDAQALDDEPSDDGQPFDGSDEDAFEEWGDEDAEDFEPEPLEAEEAAFDERETFDTFDGEAVDFDHDDVAADGGAPLESAMAEFAEDTPTDFAPSFDDVAAESQVKAELPPPPELEAILNPTSVERAPILPLPTPGNYAELATLSVFKAGEQLGEVAIDFNCTVLGLEPTDDDSDYSDAVAREVDELDEIAEFEPIEAVDAEPQEAAFELEAIENEADAYSEDDFAAFSSQQQDDVELDQAAEDDEDDFESFGDDEEFDEEALIEEPEVETEPYEDPDDLEEGPVIDLSQFGDASRFASRHGYLFRQNKHYTLYVLSDMGTQLNDEVLELGDYRELSDGDVIVLGGEVALRFNEPAA